LSGFKGGTGNSLLVFVALVQQLPSTLAFGANVHYNYNKYNKRKEWSLIDISKGARTVREMEQLSRGRARADQRYNVKKVFFFHLFLSTMS